MVNFSSIAAHLQVKIAEMMSYFDQKEFVLSSHRGKRTVQLTKCKAVLQIAGFKIIKELILYQIRRSHTEKFWSKISQYSDLPRFAVQEIEIFDGVLNTLTELEEKAYFTQDKVLIIWEYSFPTLEIFNKLTEMFNVAYFVSDRIPPPEVMCHPKFQELEQIRIPLDGFDEERLSMLKNTECTFCAPADLSRVASMTNKIFKHWFSKARSIELFEICGSLNDRSFKMDDLLVGLPSVIIWKYKEGQKNSKILLLERAEFGQYNLHQKDEIYSIDRGDKKLLVFLSETNSLIHFQEYVNLADVIEFQISDI